MADDDEVGLPQKGINMIIKEVIPDVRVANETRELLNQCCVEFVKFVAKEAQQISSRDHRKTIYHDHVQKALRNLGFPPEYVEAANSVLGECKMAAEQRLKRKHSRLDKCGIPEEELYLMQQELIERARRDEAAKVTTPTTPCPIGGGLAQFLQPKNELFMADKTTAGAEIVVKTEEMETPNEASTSGFSTSSGGVTLGQTPLFAQALFHHQGAIANGGAADNKAAEEEDYDT